MDLALRRFDIYAAGHVVALIILVILAALAFVTLLRRRSAKAENDGHFQWAQAEMAQIAAERAPELRDFNAAALGAELVFEARRMITEVSDDQHAGPRVNVEEALAHGLGAAASSGLRRRLSAHLERLEPLERRVERGSRFKHLRGVLDAEETPSPYRGSARLEREGGRKTRLVERAG